MSTVSALALELSELLGLDYTPVAVSFSQQAAVEPAPGAAQPAGCCFWAPAESRRVQTTAQDHAHCSVGSYTHGLISLEAAAAASDTAALVGSGWVAGPDLALAARLPFHPQTITYEPLEQAANPDVVLARLTPLSLMKLQGACPDLNLATKPQCQIVPLAYRGTAAVSPGCAVSRVRAGLPSGELTCALPGSSLASIVERLRFSIGADRAVADYAAADRKAYASEV